MKATIYDVAREAGVSIAAVSQVINGKGKISEERRAEIMRVMERLNYQPSVIAAALTGKKDLHPRAARARYFQPVLRRDCAGGRGSRTQSRLQPCYLQHGQQG